MGPRRRRGLHAFLGFLLGLFLGLLLASPPALLSFLKENLTCTSSTGRTPPKSHQPPPVETDPLKIIDMLDLNENRHNSAKTLLFVGVMTAQKYLPTRAVAVYDTWGKELPGRIAFFSSGTSYPPPAKPRLPLVALRGVDDSYPPQKKSFLMLQYMWQNYGDRFEWFMRADDDVYVRPDKLEKLLRSVDSKKPQFIGQAGRGNQEEFGLLSLEYDENFCMGGPGVIMSRETLSRVAPHIKYCLKNLYTTHEDVELGRCVQKFAGIPCTWSYEMQTILYHNSSGSEAFTGSLKKKEVHHAITLHPIKQHTNMYRIHNYMKSLKIQALQRELVLLERDIQASKRELGEKTPLQTAVFSDPPGLNKFHPRKTEDVLVWDFISRSIYSATNINPRRRMEAPLKEGLEDVVGEVMDTINMHSKQRGRVIEFREILYGYHRLDPLHGADYILDMLLVYKKYRGRKMTVPVRRHVYLQQQFGGLEIRETVDGVEVPQPIVREQEGDEPANLQADMSDNNLLSMGDLQPPLEIDSSPTDAVGTKIINFILPLSGRFAAFQRFVGVFEEVCLQRDKYVSLIVVLYQNPQAHDSFNQSASEVRRLQSVYPHIRIVLVPVFEKFARARALQLGASQVTDNTQDLLFLVDVDMVFMSATLQRIRTNTVKGKEVYFPIVFSEFDPSIVYGISELKSSSDHFRIDDDTGFWRQFGFGIVSIYKCDLMQVGGFDTTIQGWGKEDVNLYDKIVAFKNLTVFRAVDLTLVHVFHVVDCDPSLEETQLRMCDGSRYDTYGSAQQLAKYIYSREEIIKYLEKKVQKPLS